MHDRGLTGKLEVGIGRKVRVGVVVLYLVAGDL
jgi:hypothetical protein